MSLTRSMLKGMGLTEEQIGAIIEEHTSVTTTLKNQIKAHESNAEKLSQVEKELEDLRKDGGSWQDKYEKEKKAFDDYKKEIATKETTAKVKAAYKALLTEAKVGEKHIDSILRVTDFSKMTLDDQDKLVDADALKESIKKEWSGFIPEEGVRGAGPETPPGGKEHEQPAGTLSRAATLARSYHNNLYGKTEGN